MYRHSRVILITLMIACAVVVLCLIVFAESPFTQFWNRIQGYNTAIGVIDCDIEFLVLDAKTNDAIDGATIDLVSVVGPFDPQKYRLPQTLKCNRFGEAKYLFKDCSCSIQFGGWGPWKRHRYNLTVPTLMVQVHAPGYQLLTPCSIECLGKVTRSRLPNPPKMKVVIKANRN
jgi:hypothetical protein